MRGVSPRRIGPAASGEKEVVTTNIKISRQACRGGTFVHIWGTVANGLRRCTVCAFAYQPVPVGNCFVCGGLVYDFDHGARWSTGPKHAMCRQVEDWRVP